MSEKYAQRQQQTTVETIRLGEKDFGKKETKQRISTWKTHTHTHIYAEIYSQRERGGRDEGRCRDQQWGERESDKGVTLLPCVFALI